MYTRPLHTQAPTALATPFSPHATAPDAANLRRWDALFDRLHQAAGEFLTPEALDHELLNQGPGSWLSLRTRTHVPPILESWRLWFTGREAPARRVLRAQRPQWRNELDTLERQGRTRQVLWVHSVPLSPYGHYTRTRLTHQQECGLQVRTVDTRHLAGLHLCDLEVLPGVVYLHRHTWSGVHQGAIRLDEPPLVAEAEDLVGQFWESAARLPEID
ncbi:DUF6879 family protein [Nocardiopsis kunsanensis]|uniref:DUF6879 domain-containing protein n=1 Tax=Nocardiopsis kunsanensis TaxID=141693 RepID=A0A918XIZ8_9ACTN|nr:DUF6879 family protein [Nocardiopsis kunsanensis]GHD34524.1 hypothetical protein GCM10007147_40290 [Nocardiopsis kunsanensis]